ncbi:DUF3054 domain-containing protein [Nesterenkonia muleiensis]|uniref:DUF3054 domain-containing protein n=1 Tax=Nesterenkonia muleiensis TaxID=2282648 RepID=UPI000E72F513|nr:DUF3054 domain-containing protein [Nesterenkonia muleiensis]
MSHEISHRTKAPKRSAACLAADIVLVVLFAVLGNISHDSGLGPSDIWTTAWPFVLGVVLGWWITFSWRSPDQLWPSGVFLVLFTVAWGMMMRHFFTDGGVEVPFVLVATASLTVLLLGRRLLAKLLLPADSH